MADVKLGSVPGIPGVPTGSNDKEKLQWLVTAYSALEDSYVRLMRDLENALQMLDSSNVRAIDGDITEVTNLDMVVNSIITNVLITQSLYAERGYIAELTVDQLDTSTKVQNYLLHDTDFAASIADVNYVKIHEQEIQLISAQTDGSETMQARDRLNHPLFWDVIDDVVTHQATTLEDTGYPVTIYVYDEYIKREISFFDLDGNAIPMDVFGVGTGSEVDPNRGKGFIIKDALGLLFKYIKADGTEVWMRLGENGAEGSLGKDVEVVAIEFNTEGMDVTYADEQVHNWDFIVNGSGRIIRLDNLSTNRHIDISYSGV